MSKQQRENTLIDLKGMTKSYTVNGQLFSVLPKINMTVSKSEMVAIMGPSGSGKSTLLFILGLFLSPTEGEYLFDGKNILTLNRGQQAQFRRERIGFVLQSADMFQHSTVYENVEYPLIYARSRPSERPERIHQVLQQVNLTNRMHHSSNKLSGGEKQRVAIARAMVNHPAVILADEPTGQLDADNSQQIMEYFRSISSTTDTAMVIVTHDPNVAEKCDTVLQICNGQLL
ncbi:MAG: ABC transporter ATP-binding protein [Proteobacteria bacterium]|nr:ABC transporter ATP-binding protein [Pseudomonadota bacterium]